MRTFLVDTDTASDDAVALIMALRAPDVRVAAITVVAGNVPVDQGVRNALFTAELCGSRVPVFRGAERPLRRPAEHAHWFHGQDGLGDRGFAPSSRMPESEHAVGAICRTAGESPGLVIVTLGPLTNLALALQQDPGLAGLVSRCVVMGGNPCTEGNVTPAAEFNIWVDPDAARIVFQSGLPIEMVGWHLCRHEYALSESDIAYVRSLGTPAAHFAIDCNLKAMEAYRVQTGEAGISLPDPTAMAVALDPAVVTSSSRHCVAIETESDLTRGMTVVDRLNVSGDERNREVWREAREAPQVTVCWSLDAARFKSMLYRALA